MSDLPDTTNTPAEPAEPVVTLNYIHDDEAKSAGFLVVIPDACLASHPELAEMLPSAFMSSEPAGKRVGMLAAALRMIEAGAPSSTGGKEP